MILIQGIFNALAQIIQAIPQTIQIIIFGALIVIFMVSIIAGFLKNRSLKKKYSEKLEEVIPKYVKGKAEYEDAGGTGFRINAVPKKYFYDLSIALVLLNRENLLHPIINHFQKDKDKIAFMGTLRKTATITIEVIPREEHLIKDLFKEIVDLETVKIDKKFDAAFLVKSSEVYSARALFLAKEGQQLRAILLKYRDNIKRFAIHLEEAQSSLNAIFFLSDNVEVAKFFPIYFKMAEVYDSVDFEKYRRSYKKKRT
ncbi:MAG: hypothetical protein ACFFA5_01245 [Promethearchaeota archaeon]